MLILDRTSSLQIDPQTASGGKAGLYHPVFWGGVVLLALHCKRLEHDDRSCSRSTAAFRFNPLQRSARA